MAMMDGSKTDDTTETALGEAAMRMALGFSRPAIVSLRVALLVGALDIIWISNGFWFVLYATLTGFSPLAALFQCVLLAICSVMALTLADMYRLSRLNGVRHVLQSAAIAVGVPLVLLQISVPSDFGLQSRLFAGLILFGCVGVPLRSLVGQAVAWAVSTGLTARRAIIAGGGDEAIRVLRGLENRSQNDVRVCAFFDDRCTERVPERLFEVPKIGSFDDLVVFCQIAEIDLIILTFPLSARDRISEVLEKLKVLPVAVHLSQASGDLSFPDCRGAGLLSSTFHVERRVVKRVFDVVIGGGALLALSPIMITAAIAVKLTSSGPVFFRQERHGFNNRIVSIWKFRSMYHDCCDAAAARVVSKGDPRVTPVGRFLRKSSIDELPQLFNVLDGSLSLVGPRPHAVQAQSSQQEPFQQLVQDYSARHRLPPGITGLAQIHGYRGEINDKDQLRKRVSEDLRYIENWSIWLDIWILCRTPLALLNTRNAY